MMHSHPQAVSQSRITSRIAQTLNKALAFSLSQEHEPRPPRSKRDTARLVKRTKPKPQQTPNLTKRHCLRCNGSFLPANRFNFICKDCKLAEEQGTLLLSAADLKRQNLSVTRRGFAAGS